MKLGIDFGTTRTVVAAADRGNFPLVSFETPDGSHADWFPSLVAVDTQNPDRRLFGWAAWECQSDPQFTVLRSIKRLLEKSGPATRLDLGGQLVSLHDLLRGLVSAIAQAVRNESNLQLSPAEPLEVIIGIPAHANSNARFLTAEAFRTAGFHVLGILNEPSAASIEYGHRQRQGKPGRETVLVYDLGGGTFDASLVTLDDQVHHVLATGGISSLGGDDFDQTLAELAISRAGLPAAAADTLSSAEWFHLLEECRTKKESLNPNSRRIFIDLSAAQDGWSSVEVPVVEFYEQARPLVEETVAVSEELLASVPPDQFEALYITGGGSELPLVARTLRERFGRRVRRSAYTRSATAIGLAIQAEQPGTYKLADRLGRYFGVWREAENGTRIIFDPLFSKGQTLPAAGDAPLVEERSYQPAHNIGHFRFLECSHRTAEGTPTGDITFWNEIRFPFESALASADLASALIHSLPNGTPAPTIVERYQCDSAGTIKVAITNVSDGYTRHYDLGEWSHANKTVSPLTRARAAGA